MSDTLYLFDVSAYLHRAMYACHRDATESVDEHNAAFIELAARMVANDMERIAGRTSYMALVRDSDEPSLRCDTFPSYKQGRRPHPPVFRTQVPRFFQKMADISVAVLHEPRYEADDIIATVVRHRQSDVTIVSIDKDLLAYVGPGVDYYNPVTREWYRPHDVEAKFHVKPHQLHDYIGLVGDSSDGIPGVKGIGHTTAAKLLRAFGSLHELYHADHAERLKASITGRQFRLLMDGRADAFLSLELARPKIVPTDRPESVFSLNSFRAPPLNIVGAAIHD